MPEVIDNFLEPEDFKILANTMLGGFFPWYITGDIVGNKNINTNQLSFTHAFYDHFQINSDFFGHIRVILDKLKPEAILRIKANLYLKTDTIIVEDGHQDYQFWHKGALFTLNTSDGYTQMDDGTKIKSVANRMILFNPSVPHKSTTCTDATFRANMIINYYDGS